MKILFNDVARSYVLPYEKLLPITFILELFPLLPAAFFVIPEVIELKLIFGKLKIHVVFMGKFIPPINDIFKMSTVSFA